MPRKFRLSVHRKNEHRKNREGKIAEKQTLLHPEPVLQLPVISIPQEIYYNAPAPSLLQLKERVQKTQILPQGMNLVFNMISY